MFKVDASELYSFRGLCKTIELTSSIMLLIKTIYLHGQDTKGKNGKLHLADEKIFKETEALIYDELAYVLNVKREKMIDYIFSIL